MSQSKKGSCQGLWSAIEGDRTYTLKKGKSYHNLLYHEETHNDVGRFELTFNQMKILRKPIFIFVKMYNFPLRINVHMHCAD